jgi:hypothetical protein
MSCFIYGYVLYLEPSDSTALVSAIESLGIGLMVDKNDQLHNFPNENLPSDDGKYFYFTIGDEPGSDDSTYLTWPDNLDPITCGPIPSALKDRLKLIAKAIESIGQYFDAKKIAVAVTDSCQIEKVVTCKFYNFNDFFFDDCKKSCPPNTLYILD